MTEIKLRPWQNNAINKALNYFNSEEKQNKFLINAAPGSGKTICASVISKKLIENKNINRVIIIAPTKEVVKQWSSEFEIITGRKMIKVTGSDEDIMDYDLDLCATWASLEKLVNEFSKICETSNTLIICDEHHHAAVEATWGVGARGSFKDAKFAIILSGTPIRSDGKFPIWLSYDESGKINHPEEATYTLTYGEAVDLQYCRPITFHRHEGKFNVKIDESESVKVSGTENTIINNNLKRVKGLKQALEYYRLVCTPNFLSDGITPDHNSYQASMLKWGIKKLDEIRERLPNAGGLVIAPNIAVAEYMKELLFILTSEKPILVHSYLNNAENKISAFRNSNKKWIVSVAMVSEGVDIKRLRVLVFLPKSQTELFFRQAMGRVVRPIGNHLDDDSRAYVVMPTHKIFEKYARNVENEMSIKHRKEKEFQTKICPECFSEINKIEKICPICMHEFIINEQKKKCINCNHLNNLNSKNCEKCGESFESSYEINLDHALRIGAIIRGMDIEESEINEIDEYKDQIREDILSSGDNVLIKILKTLPEESYSRLKNILNKGEEN